MDVVYMWMVTMLIVVMHTIGLIGRADPCTKNSSQMLSSTRVSLKNDTISVKIGCLLEFFFEVILEFPLHFVGDLATHTPTMISTNKSL